MAANDIGVRVVEDLFKALMVDDEWSVRGARGFTWWAYRLAQHVEASAPTLVGDREVCEVRVWCEVANEVDAENDPAVLVSLANMHQTLNALTWDPVRRTVKECCTVMVHSGNLGWVHKVLPVAAIMQNTAAHARAQALADSLGGVPAVSIHPASGERPEPDELTSAPEQVIAPDGRQRSKFAGTLTRRLEPLAHRMGLTGFAGLTEFSCELPFTGSRPLGALIDPGDPVETSLLQVFPDVEHPTYGRGALMTLSLPVRIDPRHVADVANLLNLGEVMDLDIDRGQPPLNSSRQGTLLGAWCPDPRAKAHDKLAFNAFVPSAVARPGILDNLVIYQIVRSRFAAYQLVGRRVAEEPRQDNLDAALDNALRAAATSIDQVEISDVLDVQGDDALYRGSYRSEAEAREIAQVVVTATRQAAAQLRVPPSKVQARSWMSAVDSPSRRSEPTDWPDA